LTRDEVSLIERIVADGNRFVIDDQISHQVYFQFLEYFKNLDQIDAHHFVIGASFVYSWMPTMLRLRNSEFSRAAQMLRQARDEDISDSSLEFLKQTVNNSIVGVSKLLHFVAPDRYAIWDSRVSNYLRQNLTRKFLDHHYMDYLELCRTLAEDQRFKAVHRSINLKIGQEVSALRAVELVMYSNG
jgi:hypothetical protein